jgi:GNAT superfamily N-acetyltransferase
MTIELKEITFEEILPVWREKLWPGRKSAIEPISVIQHDGTYDMTIQQNTPTFFGCYAGDVLVGVNSGIKTTEVHYRSRGLYVDPAYRGNGIAKTLLKAVDYQATKEGCCIVWTMPRKDAWKTYHYCGYIQDTDFFNEGVEFGPNCFASKSVSSSKSGVLTTSQ